MPEMVFRLEHKNDTALVDNELVIDKDTMLSRITERKDSLAIALMLNTEPCLRHLNLRQIEGANSRYYLIRHKGDIAGFFAYHRGIGLLSKLYIKPHLRRNGIMKKAIDFLQYRNSTVYFMATADDSRVYDFAKSLDWEQIDDLPYGTTCYLIKGNRNNHAYLLTKLKEKLLGGDINEHD